MVVNYIIILFLCTQIKSLYRVHLLYIIAQEQTKGIRLLLPCPFLSDTISGNSPSTSSCCLHSIYLKNYSSARDSIGPHAILRFRGRIIALIIKALLGQR